MAGESPPRISKPLGTSRNHTSHVRLILIIPSKAQKLRPFATFFSFLTKKVKISQNVTKNEGFAKKAAVVKKHNSGELKLPRLQQRSRGTGPRATFQGHDLRRLVTLPELSSRILRKLNKTIDMPQRQFAVNRNHTKHIRKLPQRLKNPLFTLTKIVLNPNPLL